MDYQERKILVIIKKIVGVFYRILSAIKGCGHHVPSLASFGDGDTQK